MFWLSPALLLGSAKSAVAYAELPDSVPISPLDAPTPESQAIASAPALISPTIGSPISAPPEVLPDRERYEFSEEQVPQALPPNNLEKPAELSRSPENLPPSQAESLRFAASSVDNSLSVASPSVVFPTPVPTEELLNTKPYKVSEELSNSRNQVEALLNESEASEMVAQPTELAQSLPLPPKDQSPAPITSPPQPSAPKTPPVEQAEKAKSACPDLPKGEDSAKTSDMMIQVKEFRFTEHSVFTDGELNEFVPKNYANKYFLPSDLINIACKVAELYATKGYRTSGAVVEVKEDGTTVEIKIIEGRLEHENVRVTTTDDATRRGLQSYVRSRLGIDKKKPLNIDKLQESLQLLQFDSPLIDSITARLSEGAKLGDSILDVQVKPSRPLNGTLTMDNSRVPSVGSMQRRATLKGLNPLGLGDSLSVGYNNSEGSNSWDFSYVVPLTPRNTTLSLSHNRSSSRVVEPPFDDLDGDGKIGDIRSSSESYEISLRHPLTRRIIRPRPVDGTITEEPAKTAEAERAKREEARGSVFREVAVGVMGALRDSRTSLLDIPFPLSPGSDENGFTRVFGLRFFQEFTQQDAREVWFLRSQVNVGLNALDSTVNKPIPGIDEVSPDSRFVSWLGQAQWSRRVGGDRQMSPLLTVRANLQLADRALLSSEQISIGGFGTVRGYRQDIVQADNGLFATTEFQVPVARVGRLKQGVFQVIPFVDYGRGWNRGGKDPSPNELMSTGLGLRFQYDQFTARLDWGIPLISVQSKGDTWQDNGFHFSLQWNGL